MKTMQLNVGLNTTEGDNRTLVRGHRASLVIATLKLAGATVLRYRRHEVDYNGPDGHAIDDTLILEVIEEDWMGRMRMLGHILSCDADQECIAVRFSDGTGQLIGPGAYRWGEFNPDYFVSIDAVADATALAA